MSLRAPAHLLVVLTLFAAPAVASAAEGEPTFLHGVSRVVRGGLWDPAKTVLEATMDGPPVAGTVVGILAGLFRGIETVLGGFQEIAEAMLPQESKRSRRR